MSYSKKWLRDKILFRILTIIHIAVIMAYIVLFSKYYSDKEVFLELLISGFFIYFLILIPWDISRISNNRVRKHLKTIGSKKYSEKEIEYAYEKAEEDFWEDFWNISI